MARAQARFQQASRCQPIVTHRLRGIFSHANSILQAERKIKLGASVPEFRRLTVKLDGFGAVFSHPLPLFKAKTQFGHGIRFPLRRGQTEIADGLFRIRLSALPVKQRFRQIELGVRIAIFRSQTVKTEGFRSVLSRSHTAFQAESQAELGVRQILLRRQPIVTHRLLRILFAAFSEEEEVSEKCLSAGTSLVGSASKPESRLAGVGARSVSVLPAGSQCELRLRVPPSGSLTVVTKRLSVPVPIFKMQTELEAGFGGAFLSRPPQKTERFRLVRLHANAFPEADSQIEKCLRMTVSTRQTEKTDRLRRISLHAPAIEETDAQIELTAGTSLPGRLMKQMKRGAKVLGHAVSKGQIHAAQAEIVRFVVILTVPKRRRILPEGKRCRGRKGRGKIVFHDGGSWVIAGRLGG